MSAQLFQLVPNTTLKYQIPRSAPIHATPERLHSLQKHRAHGPTPRPRAAASPSPPCQPTPPKTQSPPLHLHRHLLWRLRVRQLCPKNLKLASSKSFPDTPSAPRRTAARSATTPFHTSSFMHYSLLHLAGNMTSLYWFGPLVSDVLGPRSSVFSRALGGWFAHVRYGDAVLLAVDGLASSSRNLFL